jgi:alpha-mannosidase
MRIDEILIYHHSHFDIGYTQHPSNVWARQRDFIRYAMELAERYENNKSGEKFKWTCESLAVVHVYLNRASSEEAERFVQLVKKGLIEVSAMFFNVTPLLSLSELIESLEYAANLKQKWGISINTAVNHDVNGQSWALPDLLADFGIKLLLMGINQDMARPQTPRPRAFLWEGYTGKTILVWNGDLYGFGQVVGIPRPVAWHGHPINLESSSKAIQKYLNWLEKTEYPYDFVVLSVTNMVTWDNDSPNEELVRFVSMWNDSGRLPKMRLITPSEIIAHLERQKKQTIELVRGEWTDWWANGVGSASRETALKLWASRVREGAQVLRAFLPLPKEDENEFSKLDEEVGRHLLLFSEHTWGSARSVRLPHSIDSIGQWVSKANHAYEGAAEAWRLWVLAVRGLAKSLAEQSEKFLVFNPLPWSVSLRLKIPGLVRPDKMFGSWPLHRVNQILEFSSHLDGTNSDIGWFDYGLVKLPPCGYKVLDFEYDPLPSDTSVVTGRWELKNKWLKLKIDVKSGSISSLVTLDDNYEWVDSSKGYGLSEYVYHVVRSPNGRAELQPPSGRRDLEPFSETPAGDIRPLLAIKESRVTELVKQETRKGRGYAEIALSCKVEGAKQLDITYTLYDDAPWLDISVAIDKQAVFEPPESIYITFPFNVKNGIARYASGGAIVTADLEQLPNSCRDFYLVQNWVDFSNEERGITLITPDAPLVCIWGFSVGAYAERFNDQPFIISWVMNNHWWTNFLAAQCGKVVFRYRVLPHKGQFDPTFCEKAGIEASLPTFAFALVKGEAGGISENPRKTKASERSILSCKPDTIHFISAKVLQTTATERKILLRMHLLNDVNDGAISLNFPVRIKDAWMCDIQGTPTQKLGLIDERTLSYSGRAGQTLTLGLTIEYEVAESSKPSSDQETA